MWCKRIGAYGKRVYVLLEDAPIFVARKILQKVRVCSLESKVEQTGTMRFTSEMFFTSELKLDPELKAAQGCYSTRCWYPSLKERQFLSCFGVFWVFFLVHLIFFFL